MCRGGLARRGSVLQPQRFSSKTKTKTHFWFENHSIVPVCQDSALARVALLSAGPEQRE